jgi:hypothetical protein
MPRIKSSVSLQLCIQPPPRSISSNASGINWPFIKNLINTDPGPLGTISNYIGPDPLSFMEEGMVDPEFTAEEIIKSNQWFENNLGALDYNMEDIYDAKHMDSIVLFSFGPVFR